MRYGAAPNMFVIPESRKQSRNTKYDEPFSTKFFCGTFFGECEREVIGFFPVLIKTLFDLKSLSTPSG